MIAIVDRVATITGTNPVELSLLWEACVNSALEAGYDDYDSKTFVIAARLFLNETGVQLTYTDIKRLAVKKGIDANAPAPGGNCI